MFPVLGVLGPRQVGKSTFLMGQWREQMPTAAYITFDKQEVVVRARQSPESLLLSESNHQERVLIIDEAQKVPQIFDSIKVLVNQKRRMGSFVLSGSVDFSSKSGVRNSLAGCMGITRLYPMTVGELAQREFNSPWVSLSFSEEGLLSSKGIERWFDRGGMPIFCGLGDSDERMALVHS